jgi:hypothetical protein
MKGATGVPYAGLQQRLFCARSESDEDGGLVDLRSEKDVNFKNKIESYGDEGGKQRR